MIRTNQKGFTLVELIVVVAILGVLAAVAIPNYMNYLYKSRISTDVDTARAVLNVARTMQMTGGDDVTIDMTSVLKEADLTGKNAATGGTLEDVLGDIDTTDRDNYKITITIGDKGNPDKWELAGGPDEDGTVCEHGDLPFPQKKD